MLTSLSLIFLVGLAMGAICSKLKLPRIIGMLATGIILGPYVLDLLDPSILSISAELRKMALVIILLKAGLSLNLQDLKKVGRPAIMLSFVPATFEIIGYILLAPIILGLTHTEQEDEHLTNDSMHFHEHLGYELVGTFKQCGYKFNKWYDMIWMEKMIGEHPEMPEAFIPFSVLNYAEILKLI